MFKNMQILILLQKCGAIHCAVYLFTLKKALLIIRDWMGNYVTTNSLCKLEIVLLVLADLNIV